MRKSILAGLGIAAVAAMVLAAGSVVEAQRGPRGVANPEGRGRPATGAPAENAGRPGAFQGQPGRGRVAMADRLELTDTQREAIETAAQDNRDAVAPLVDERRLAAANLERAIFADQVDSNEVARIAAVVANLDQRIAAMRLEARVAFAGVLTAEQRATVRAAPGRVDLGLAGTSGPGRRGRP